MSQPQNFVVRLYPQGDGSTVIELRLRTGRWPAVLIAVPIEEQDYLPERPFCFGPPRQLPEGAPVLAPDDYGELGDGLYWYVTVAREVSTDQSCYVFFHEMPSELLFGPPDDDELYRIRPGKRTPLR